MQTFMHKAEGRIYTYMRDKIGHLSAAHHYLDQCWIIVQWNLAEKFQGNLNRNGTIFLLEYGHYVLTSNYRVEWQAVFYHDNKNTLSSTNTLMGDLV